MTLKKNMFRKKQPVLEFNFQISSPVSELQNQTESQYPILLGSLIHFSIDVFLHLHSFPFIYPSTFERKASYYPDPLLSVLPEAKKCALEIDQTFPSPKCLEHSSLRVGQACESLLHSEHRFLWTFFCPSLIASGFEER